MLAIGVSLLAALVPKADRPSGSPGGLLDKWQLLPPGLYMVGALLIGAGIIAIASRWRRAPRSGAASASEQLTEFRLLYEKGEMSREEFTRVRARLSEEIRGPEPALPLPAPAPTAENSVTPASPPEPQSSKTPAPAPPLQPPPDGRPAEETPSDGVPPT
jgi:hypothetical protein